MSHDIPLIWRTARQDRELRMQARAIQGLGKGGGEAVAINLHRLMRSQQGCCGESKEELLTHWVVSDCMSSISQL